MTKVSTSFSQNQDSIKLFSQLQSSVKDEDKIQSHIKIAKYFLDRNVEISIRHAEKVLQIAEANHDKVSIADAKHILGEAYFVLEDMDKASSNFLESLTEYKKLKHHRGTGETTSGLGKVAYKKGEVSAALTYFSEALTIFENINYENGLPGLYINIAILYDEQNNFKQALEYYNKALNMAIKIEDDASVAAAYTNIGGIYGVMGEFKKAIDAIEKSIEIKKKLGNKKGLAVAYNNLGATYYEMKDLNKAYTCFQQAYDLYIDMNDEIGIFPSCNNVGSVLLETNRVKEALPFFEKGYEIAIKINSVSKQMVSLENLTLAHKALGNYQKALDYSIQCSSLKDTLYNKEQAEITTELQTKFASEKKQQENEILNLQLKSESFTKSIFIVVAILLLVLVFFIFRGLRIKNKANIALEEKNKIIHEQTITLTHQKHIVEEQHKDIKDSIRYAERIQQAILPPEKVWFSILPDSFVFYKPKDILSGDFYWIEQKGDLIFVAAADCTGHGVPGALISIVNYNLLNKAVLEKDLNDPAEILNYVNKQLIIALHQTYQESSVKDGMDIALCVINKKSRELKFAGANNPAYVLHENQIIQLNPDKFPVGAFIEDQINEFKTIDFQLHIQDSVYLFSDGIADQFGGPKGKKFKYTQFKSLLLSHQESTMANQKSVLDQTLTTWKGDLEQVDDILVIGFKI